MTANSGRRKEKKMPDDEARVVAKFRAWVRWTTSRDATTFALRWPGKALVVAALVLVPAALLVVSILRGSYTDYSWRAIEMLLVLLLVYLLSRRLLLTLAIATIVVVVTSLAIFPVVSSAPTGNGTLLEQLENEAKAGTLVGFHYVAVGVVDLSSPETLSFAGLGADASTRMEVGSLTKAMTGLVIADSVARGELRMDEAVSTYLPQLKGTLAGAATLQQLVTHTAGYSEFGSAALGRALWLAPVGMSFLGANLDELIADTGNQDVTSPGRYAYSTLGAAIAGQAAAAAAGMSYADLMRTRLFVPLNMNDTVIQEDSPLVPGGRSESGLPVAPWTLGAYAPGGGAISTVSDLTKLASALLHGTAPGMSSLDPTTATSQSDTLVGTFWYVTQQESGATITWHSGETGGYTTYFGLDRGNGTAVIVLSDVANRATDFLGTNLFPQHK